VGLAELGRTFGVWWIFTSVFVVQMARKVLGIGGRRSWGEALAIWVRVSFERLGPNFIKLGQMVASAPGIFPKVVSDECLKLLDSVPPVPLEVIHDTIVADLGHGIDALVESWDPEPLSAASIAQVHACVLRDGRHAVVKVQRPNLKHDIERDLRIQYRIARFADRFERAKMFSLPAMVQDLNRSLHEELNFLLEATNTAQFRDNIGYFGDNKWVTAPEVYWELCGPRVLCMERLYGVKLDDFEEIQRRDLDSLLILRRGVKVWMEAAFFHGLFHGDVHAGNLMVLDDGRAAYLDFGICGRLPEKYREGMRLSFQTYAIDRDYDRLVRAMQLMEMLPADLPEDQVPLVAQSVKLFVDPFVDKPVGELSIAEMFAQQLEMAKHFDMVGDPALALIGKQLLYFERYVKHLAPGWGLQTDVFLFKNLFPEAVEAKCAADGIELPE